jgi:hypothetical protein
MPPLDSGLERILSCVGIHVRRGRARASARPRLDVLTRRRYWKDANVKGLRECPERGHSASLGLLEETMALSVA